MPRSWLVLDNQLLISGRKGRSLKTRQESGAEVAAWVRANPAVVSSNLGQDTALAPAPAVDGPARAAGRSKILLQTSQQQLCSDLPKPEAGFPETVASDGRRETINAAWAHLAF